LDIARIQTYTPGILIAVLVITVAMAWIAGLLIGLIVRFLYMKDQSIIGEAAYLEFENVEDTVHKMQMSEQDTSLSHI
jgi:hypothetical protein